MTSKHYPNAYIRTRGPVTEGWFGRPGTVTRVEVSPDHATVGGLGLPVSIVARVEVSRDNDPVLSTGQRAEDWIEASEPDTRDGWKPATLKDFLKLIEQASERGIPGVYVPHLSALIDPDF